MAHELLRKTLRNALRGQTGGEGVAQSMEVQFAALRVDALNSSLFHIAPDEAVIVCAFGKDGFAGLGRIGGNAAFESIDEFRVQRNDRLSAVLGRGGAGDNARKLFVKDHVGPNQLPELPDTQSGEGGGQIEQATLWRGFHEPLQLFVTEGPALLLAAANIDLGNGAQRVGRNPFIAHHPVEKRVEGVQVLVDRLGRKVRLLRAPADKSVGVDVGRQLPIAGAGNAHHAEGQNARVTFRAPERTQVRREILKVLFNRQHGGFAFEFGSNDPGTLAFLLGNQLVEPLAGHLLVRSAQRNLGDAIVAVEAVAPAPDTTNFGLSVGSAVRFENVGNHDCCEIVFKCSMYVKLPV